MSFNKMIKIFFHQLTKGKSFFSRYSVEEKNNIICYGQTEPALVNKKESTVDKRILRKEKKMTNTSFDDLNHDLEKILKKYGPEKIEEVLKLKKENELCEGDWVLTKFKPNEYRKIKKIELSDDKNIKYEITGVNDSERVYVDDQDILRNFKVKKELTNLDTLFLYKGREPQQWKLGDVALIKDKNDDHLQQLDFFTTKLFFINSDADLKILSSIQDQKICIPLVFREGRLDYIYLNAEEEKETESHRSDSDYADADGDDSKAEEMSSEQEDDE